MERFSIEYRKTNKKWRKNIARSQWEGRVKTNNLSKARENPSDKGAIGFGFASDWLRE